MLSPHEIATLLLAAASLGPIDADALEPPDLAALEQARLVHVAVDEGHTKVSVTEDGHRVLRRLGLERSGGERAQAPHLTIAPAQRPRLETVRMEGGRSAADVAASATGSRTVTTMQIGRDVSRPIDMPQAASLPADASGIRSPETTSAQSEHREEEA
ncbi:hypothetical protein PCA20602_02797 [Pandoraea capi]|uniref:Uncharacterized protein n=1 Tax=Pandoraea capi TaxID=2508286 RepID=A0ABY6W188_9BURK|nr:hypothetical protein [Pandoraea capi]VVE14203.1 hypothetical protein PCA20602_02797 [Pandoraea capi]